MTVAAPFNRPAREGGVLPLISDKIRVLIRSPLFVT
jgi:hypothetical protein